MFIILPNDFSKNNDDKTTIKISKELEVKKNTIFALQYCKKLKNKTMEKLKFIKSLKKKEVTNANRNWRLGRSNRR